VVEEMHIILVLNPEMVRKMAERPEIAVDWGFPYTLCVVAGICFHCCPRLSRGSRRLVSLAGALKYV
jgi:hypothetical protein